MTDKPISSGIPSDPKHVAPWEGGEQLVSWQSLHERAEGKQISGVYFLLNELPKGWEGVGFEFTTSDVMIAMAVPSLEKEFAARLLIRWVMPQGIWTPGMENVFKRGKGRASIDECPVCPQCRPDPCPAHQVQGEVIKLVYAPKEPTSTQGDVWLFEFVSGTVMRLCAEPSDEGPWAASLDLQVTAKQRIVFNRGCGSP